MSTRGAVAFGTERDWRGVYNHADSMPQQLGASVWRVLAAARMRGDALTEVSRAMDAAGRWESFAAGEADVEPLALSSANADPLLIRR